MHCPICHQSESYLLLSLKNNAIYQHPVNSDVIIPSPHHLDLEYRFCKQCGHAFQRHFDSALMDRIYANHYYTPAPDNIGHQFRDEFFNAITSLESQLSDECSILEIGSSSGDVLERLKHNHPHALIVGYEPSQETAHRAIAKGIPTRVTFFSPQTITNESKSYDMILSRHVIEHITNFDEFWQAIALVSNQSSLLILETPSLEYAMSKPSISPFHVEHAHVFSSHSLASLAAGYGWHLMLNHITESGNMVLGFRQSTEQTLLTSCPSLSTRLKNVIQYREDQLRREIGDRKVILWGAGAGGLSLITSHQLEPAEIVDGNQNKKGKKFYGLPWEIHFAPEVISRIQDDKQDDNYIIVIGSTFYREIRESLINMNWRGAVSSPFEWDYSFLMREYHE